MKLITCQGGRLLTLGEMLGEGPHVAAPGASASSGPSPVANDVATDETIAQAAASPGISPSVSNRPP